MEFPAQHAPKFAVEPLPFPQWRQDVISGRWTIVATERAARPIETRMIASKTTVSDPSTCPFCPGNEQETPPELFAYRPVGTSSVDGKGWKLRVVPNRFPAVRPAPPSDVHLAGMHRWTPGRGEHELLIQCDDHLRDFAELSPTQSRWVVRCWRDRVAYHRRQGKYPYALLFQNVGGDAGASLEHLHSQLITLLEIPPLVREELAGAERYFLQNGRCGFCMMVEHELADGRRVVAESKRFVVFCPFASRFAFEMWLLPRFHALHFDTLSDDDAHEAADLLHQVVRRLSIGLDQPAYNFVLHTAPFVDGDARLYHWHWEILPRLTSWAGFECGGGWTVIAVPPEQAAQFLRRVEV